MSDVVARRMLSAEAWSRLVELFSQATDLPESERIDFAYAQTDDAPELRQELLALIAADEDATRRLREPLQRAVEVLLQADEANIAAGTRFGPWSVQRVIGVGGMGRVYLAQRADGAYEREVALKLVRSQALSERRHLHFEYECRLLAQMQHPAIAQIHDAGIDPEGRAYLVMEYIQGQAITDWCDQHALSMRERVELLVKVAEGVQHAHQKGVIHRDLKPGNVLVCSVDGQAMPKIIDFGIAVEAEGAETSGAGGTPGYMSPEQSLPGSDVDARSDVYSLGAMLYELACGARAGAPLLQEPSQQWRNLTPERQQQLAAARGSKPAQLLRDLRDGLDAIAIKALRNERADRYASVSLLLEDLRRWLRHYPPQAAGRTGLLALRKFVRRNRLMVLAAAVVVAVLLAGLVATAWSLREARQEAARAKVSSGFLASVLDSMDPAMAEDLDKTLMLRVLEDASRRAPQDLSAYPDTLADMRLIIAINQIVLGEYDRAIDHLEAIRKLADKHPGVLELQRLRALQVLGDAYVGSDRYTEAQAVLDEGIAKARAGDPAHLWLAYDMQSRLSWVRFVQGKAPEALALAKEALDGFIRIAPADDQQRLDAVKRYANLLSTSGDYTQSIALMDDVVRRRTHINGLDHPLTLVARRDLVTTRLRMRDFAGAEPELRQLLAAYERIYGPDNGYPIGVRGMLGSALREQGKVQEAGPHYRATMEWNARRFGPESQSTVVARHNHANWLLAAGQASASRDEQRALLAIADRSLGRANHVTAEILRGLAEAELAMGERINAHEHASAALAAMREVYGDQHEGALRDVRATLQKVETAAESVVPVLGGAD
ncbi:serine/threonine-protein kinase [Stenotrophomonas pigmentata]|uniref:serine/threonine-protein kinase n=1 Tax=Stenotrophomonas pigmentata TaxID=3055080 RepID=UPI0026EF7D22|nr:serine/threonine-protein kinase [Stenotrophomonas sp. 610A2]